LRQSNVMRLEWSQVDIERSVAWIHPDQAKGRKAIHVPLSSVAISVLKRQHGKHPSRVFTFRGKPIRQVNTKAWQKALKRAGIENFRWHDWRNVWATARDAGDQSKRTPDALMMVPHFLMSA